MLNREKIINKKQLMEHACKNIIHTCVSMVLCHQRNLQRVIPPCVQVDYLASGCMKRHHRRKLQQPPPVQVE